MRRFLNEIPSKQVGMNPIFVNPIVDTREITKAGTSGNELTDIIYDKAKGIVNNLTELKRQNELTKIELDANQKIQDYELSWTTPDINGNIKDKYSDENYPEYLDGLQKIYDENKLLITDTKYTNASDVNKWEKTVQTNLNNAFYTEEGKKSEYDINKATDETLLNIDSIDSQIIANGDADGKLTEQKLALYNGLEKLGIPEHKIEAMKIKSLVDTDVARMKLEIQEVVDSTLSIEKKRERLIEIKNGFNTKSVYTDNAEQAVEKGLINKKYASFYKDYSERTIKEAMLSADGHIANMELRIRDEEYRNTTAIESKIRQREKQIEKDQSTVIQAVKTGDNYKAISIIEDRPITGYDLVSNIELSQKYYGFTPEEILWKQESNNKYIATKGIYEINNIKHTSALDKQNGIKRSVTVESLYNDITNENLDDNEKENSKREYIGNGLISNLEYGVMNGTVRFETDTKQNMINYSDIGKSNTKDNKLKAFSEINVSSNLAKAVSKLDYYQKEEVSNIIIGAIKSKTEFIGKFSGGPITLGAVNKKYNSDPSFREFVDDVIQGVKSSDKTKYISQDMKKQDYINMVNKKYSNDPIIIRHTTQESGINSNIERIGTDYLNF